MCVDIVIVITGTSVYGLSEVWECATVLKAKEDVCVPACIYALQMHVLFFSSSFCFHVSMWRLMVPGLDGGVLAPAGLLRPASA